MAVARRSKRAVKRLKRAAARRRRLGAAPRHRMPSAATHRPLPTRKGDCVARPRIEGGAAPAGRDRRGAEDHQRLDVRPAAVLNMLVEFALHLCEADAANIWLPNGNVLKLAASSGHSDEFKRFAAQNPIAPGRGTVSGRVFLEGNTVHLPDVLADREFTGTGYQSRGRYRNHLGVPMLRESRAIGVFALTRTNVAPFSDRQIHFVETFANQAVIAIENARLLETEKQRTRELAKSLELLQRERNNKIMNLEAMVASIGHEVRQPLTAIASNGNAALRFLGHEPPIWRGTVSSEQDGCEQSSRQRSVRQHSRLVWGSQSRTRADRRE